MKCPSGNSKAGWGPVPPPRTTSKHRTQLPALAAAAAAGLKLAPPGIDAGARPSWAARGPNRRRFGVTVRGIHQCGRPHRRGNRGPARCACSRAGASGRVAGSLSLRCDACKVVMVAVRGRDGGRRGQQQRQEEQGPGHHCGVARLVVGLRWFRRSPQAMRVWLLVCNCGWERGNWVEERRGRPTRPVQISSVWYLHGKKACSCHTCRMRLACKCRACPPTSNHYARFFMLQKSR